MPIDPQKLMALAIPDVTQSYDARDVILYALGLGIGLDAEDDAALAFVYEPALRVLPSFAAAVAYPPYWLRDLETGIDFTTVVHGEQSLRLHRPIPCPGTVIGRTRITDVFDKGAETGAVLVTERRIVDAADGGCVATLIQTVFCRSEGGFGGARGPASPPAAVPMPPARPADHVVDRPTSPQTALVYRLSGDPNPLHADPAVARAAGFAKPILHGLATYGIAGYAILRSCCGHDPRRFTALAGRFSAPVFPGETIRTEIWREGASVFFRALARERNVVVFDRGLAQIEE